jgi:hypothetical protein
MRPRASWTAKTAVFSLAAGLAATAVGSTACVPFRREAAHEHVRVELRMCGLGV